jgi:Flp pilus assembly protein TadG
MLANDAKPLSANAPNLAANESGATMVEFGLIASLLILILLGIVDVSYA